MRSARIAASVCGEVCPPARVLGIRALGVWLLKRGERWAERGQLALEQGHVCVLNATALATEVLKNLTLPGIGHFTLVDKQRITGAPPRARARAVGAAAARCRVCVRKLRALALRVHTVPAASGTPDFLRPACRARPRQELFCYAAEPRGTSLPGGDEPAEGAQRRGQGCGTGRGPRGAHRKVTRVLCQVLMRRRHGPARAGTHPEKSSPHCPYIVNALWR
jgi:hypothetical protein